MACQMGMPVEGGLVNSYLGNAHIHEPLLKRGLPLTSRGGRGNLDEVALRCHLLTTPLSMKNLINCQLVQKL